MVTFKFIIEEDTKLGENNIFSITHPPDTLPELLALVANVVGSTPDELLLATSSGQSVEELVYSDQTFRVILQSASETRAVDVNVTNEHQLDNGSSAEEPSLRLMALVGDQWVEVGVEKGTTFGQFRAEAVARAGAESPEGFYGAVLDDDRFEVMPLVRSAQRMISTGVKNGSRVVFYNCFGDVESLPEGDRNLLFHVRGGGDTTGHHNEGHDDGDGDGEPPAGDQNAENLFAVVHTKGAPFSNSSDWGRALNDAHRLYPSFEKDWSLVKLVVEVLGGRIGAAGEAVDVSGVPPENLEPLLTPKSALSALCQGSNLPWGQLMEVEYLWFVVFNGVTRFLETEFSKKWQSCLNRLKELTEDKKELMSVYESACQLEGLYLSQTHQLPEADQLQHQEGETLNALYNRSILRRDAGEYTAALEMVLEALEALDPKVQPEVTREVYLLLAELLVRLEVFDKATCLVKALFCQSQADHEVVDVSDILGLLLIATGTTVETHEEHLFLTTVPALEAWDHRDKGFKDLLADALKRKSPTSVSRTFFWALMHGRDGNMDALKTFLEAPLKPVDSLDSSSLHVPSFSLERSRHRDGVSELCTRYGLECEDGKERQLWLLYSLAIVELTTGSPLLDRSESPYEQSIADIGKEIEGVVRSAGHPFLFFDTLHRGKYVRAWLLRPLTGGGVEVDFVEWSTEDDLDLYYDDIRRCIGLHSISYQGPSMTLLGRVDKCISMMNHEHDDEASCPETAVSLLERVQAKIDDSLTGLVGHGDGEGVLEVDAETREFRALGGDGGSGGDPSDSRCVLKQAYKHLWSRIDEKFGERLGSSFVLVAPTSISRFPLHLLLSDNDKCLGQVYTFTLTPSVRFYGAQSRRQAQQQPSRLKSDAKALIVCDPTPRPRHCCPLPGGRLEAEAVAKSLSGQPFVLLDGPDATRESVIKHLPDVSLAYFVTHGVASWDGTGLVMSTPKTAPQPILLTPNDVAGTDGRVTHPGGRLAVLSCCKSGVGASARDGLMMSMTPAFLRARFGVVLATLWAIPDVDMASALSPRMSGLIETPVAAFHEAIRDISCTDSGLWDALRTVGSFTCVGALESRGRE